MTANHLPLPRPLAALVSAVSLLALFVFVASLSVWNDLDLAFLAALIVITVTSEIYDFSPFKNSAVSISIAAILAAGILEGLPGVVVLSIAAALADFVAHRPQTVKALFNFSAMLLTGAAFVAVFSPLSESRNESEWLPGFGPAVAGGCAAFLVNSLLLAFAISMETGRRFSRVWNEDLRWALGPYVVLCIFSLFMTTAYARWDIPGLVLVLLPLSTIWLVLKVYTGRIQTTTPVVRVPL